MSTLLELINEVLRRTGQQEASSLAQAPTPVAQARDFLNETYVEMLQRLKVNRLQKRASLTTSPDTASYNLAEDAEINTLLADSVVNINTGHRLQEVDYTHVLGKEATPSDQPVYFYRSGDLLYLHPTPNQAYTIQYQYLVKPTHLSSDEDTPELPLEWEKILILGTQARLEKFLGEPSQDTYLLYRDGLSQLKSRAPLKPAYRMQGFYRGHTP